MRGQRHVHVKDSISAPSQSFRALSVLTVVLGRDVFKLCDVALDDVVTGDGLVDTSHALIDELLALRVLTLPRAVRLVLPL